MSPHQRSILQALFVTLLWSSSWVLIKIGLNDLHIPALSFAALRYGLAFVVLLVYGAATGRLKQLRLLNRGEILFLVMLGFIYYALTQGSQFLALALLPSSMLSLMLNFSVLVVALAGTVILREFPTRQQWAGMAVFLSGVLIYLYPIDLPAEIALGLVIGGVSMLANSAGSIMGRYINRDSKLSPFIVTLVSMGVGAALLVGAGMGFEEVTPIPPAGWALIIWLAIVNTAFAYSLWNLSLQRLSAAESSVINNTMLIQIALLAWVFLGEPIRLQEGVGLLVATAGILIVQLRRVPSPQPLSHKGRGA